MGLERHSSRAVLFQVAACVHSIAPVAAYASPVVAPDRGDTRSNDVFANTPGPSTQRFRKPIDASASRPLNASRARYSENILPLRR